MRNITISAADSGQRLDKYLLKYMPNASKGFIYKMLRKKNIKLNNAKAAGSEMLSAGDSIALYLSEDTIRSFMGNDSRDDSLPTISIKKDSSYEKILVWEKFSIPVIYEDDNILLLNKPSGLLSQKAKDTDVSLVEILESYVRNTVGDGVQKPGIANRLDRNTSGIVACGKTLAGLQELSAAVRERRVDKFYRCVVKGNLSGKKKLTGYLVKDEKTNVVKLVDSAQKADFIQTEYESIKSGSRYSYLSVKLITGKTHQIRAHLSSIGHPLIGDIKYGSKEKGMNHFLLHSYELRFGKENGVLAPVSGKSFIAPVPAEFGEYIDLI